MEVAGGTVDELTGVADVRITESLAREDGFCWLFATMAKQQPVQTTSSYLFASTTPAPRAAPLNMDPRIVVLVSLLCVLVVVSTCAVYQSCIVRGKTKSSSQSGLAHQLHRQQQQQGMQFYAQKPSMGVSSSSSCYPAANPTIQLDTRFMTVGHGVQKQPYPVDSISNLFVNAGHHLRSMAAAQKKLR